MLRVWFSSSPFVPSEHGVKMTAPLEVCTKDKHQCSSAFFGVWGNERGTDPSTIGCQVWTELFATVKRTSGSKCLKAAEPVLWVQTGKDAHPQTHQTWSMLKQ
jgi:hypothetical protein